MRVGSNGQAIGSTVFDAIVRSWLWSTAARSFPLGYFSSIQLIIDPTISDSRFSSMGLLAIEDVTFFYLPAFMLSSNNHRSLTQFMGIVF